MSASHVIEDPRMLTVGPDRLPAEWTYVPDGSGVTVFVHGSGSSHTSARNRFLARVLQSCGQSTLLFDLLSPQEAAVGRVRFNIPLLAQRLEGALDWVAEELWPSEVAVGLFGSSTGAAAALRVAAQHPRRVRAVVSRGGRLDLAGIALARVHAPTLLVVGSLDPDVLRLNREVLQALRCIRRLDVVPGATHLFEEPGALQTVARLAGRWLSGNHEGAMPEGPAA